MAEFAVFAKGCTEEGQAQWVLAIDPVGDRLLLSHSDGSLHWYPMQDCRLVKFLMPDAPRTVIPVQPQAPSLVVPAGLKANGQR